MLFRSLSSTDYQFTKDISKQFRPVLNRDNRRCSFDSSDSSTTCSDFSYSPPSTQQSSFSSLSEGTGKDMFQKYHSLDTPESCPTGLRISKLPPLNPQRIRRPSRPSPEKQSPIFETFEENNRKRPAVRPKSAHGRRTISNNHKIDPND